MQRMQTWGNGLTDQNIAQWAGTVVSVLAARDDALAAIVLKSGPIDLPDVQAPDPALAAKAALGAATQVLSQYQLLVNSGAMQENDALYVGAVAAAKAAIATFSSAQAQLAQTTRI